MKAHRQYVKEQIKKDRRFAKDLEEVRVSVRIAVMITRMREDKGLSQRDLARITGLKQPQIARIESGDYLPTLETLMILADALGAQVIIGPHQSLEIKAA